MRNLKGFLNSKICEIFEIKFDMKKNLNMFLQGISVL